MTEAEIGTWKRSSRGRCGREKRLRAKRKALPRSDGCEIVVDPSVIDEYESVFDCGLEFPSRQFHLCIWIRPEQVAA